METLLKKIEKEKRTRITLSNCVKIKHGFAFKGEYFSDKPTKDILVTPGNFAIGGGFKSDKFKYYSGAVSADYILKSGDLIVTMTDLSVDADTLGYSALVPKVDGINFLHNQRIGLVKKLNEEIDLGFLNYVMRTREYQLFVVSGASGSTVRHTSPDRITSYEYNFPTLPIQQKIAEVLGAYDKKIENNNTMIKKLEATAQAIFDEWFVKFRFPGYKKTKFIESEMGEIPAGWEIKDVKEVFTVVLGGTPSREKLEYWNGSIPWINSGEVNKLRILEATENITELGMNRSNARLIKSGATVLAITGATLGQVSRLEIDSTANQSVVGVYDEKKVLNEYLYFYITNNIFDLISGASGGAQQHINKQIVEDYKILIPSEDVVMLFNEKIILHFLLIKELFKENISLKSQRDKLIVKII